MIDLTTRYLGFTLRSPLVASAGPLTGNPEMWERLEAAGVGAVVLPSLFEEEIEADAFAIDGLLDAGTDSFGEALSYLPDLDTYDTGPNRHLALVEQARERLSVPVIASLNGTSPGGWVRYARHLVDAGAEALELNFFDVVVDPELTAHDVEVRYLELIEAVKAETKVPLAVKLSPWFTALANFSRKVEEAGANGLVLFNRFYQPDIDIETLEVRPKLHLSSSAALQLPLHWIGILYGQVGCSLAASSGVHEGADVIRLLLAGADVVCSTSALLKHGPEHLHRLESVLKVWMESREYESVEQMKGSVSRRNVPDPQAYQRANYYQIIHSWAGAVR
jgi:dihydroorotate dehydrogenase (fumarate)